MSHTAKTNKKKRLIIEPVKDIVVEEPTKIPSSRNNNNNNKSLHKGANGRMKSFHKTPPQMKGLQKKKMEGLQLVNQFGFGFFRPMRNLGQASP